MLDKSLYVLNMLSSVNKDVIIISTNNLNGQSEDSDQTGRMPRLI